MGYFVDNQGNYYEGDRANLSDKSVSQRPSKNHNFINNEWVLDEDKDSEEKENEEFLKTKDEEINFHLNTWVNVSKKIDKIETVDELKEILKSIGRIVYIIAKNKSK